MTDNLNDNLTGPELFADASGHLDDIAHGETGDPRFGETDSRILYATIANARATQALTAMVATLITAVSPDGCEPYEMDAWREVLPMPPLKECKGKEIRRPECAELHTEDCQFADPPPEHVLLDVGTYVLVSDWERERDHEGGGYTLRLKNPVPGKISGYDMHRSKYRYRMQYSDGVFASTDAWAFADNRVEVHPDGPVCPPPPQPVKREPTGPCVYVEHRLGGTQGHIVAMVPLEGAGDGTATAEVLWYEPGAQPVREKMGNLLFITPDRIERCPSGQTRDECGPGDECELCLAGNNTGR